VDVGRGVGVDGRADEEDDAEDDVCNDMVGIRCVRMVVSVVDSDRNDWNRIESAILDLIYIATIL